MAPETFIYSLYQVACPGASPAALLLRVTRPAYQNASQAHADWAEAQADGRRAQLLEAYQAWRRAAGGGCNLTLLGVCEGEPPGDALYEDHGWVDLDLWVAATRFGPPWVLLGVAASEADFFAEIADNSLYASYAPVRPAQRLRAFFITEADAARLRGAEV